MAPPTRRLLFAMLAVIAAFGVAATHFTLGPTQPTATASTPTANEASAEHPAQVHGRILDSNGDAVASARVRVSVDGRLVAMTNADAGGRYAFGGLPLGGARLSADHDPEGAARSAPIVISTSDVELTLVLAPASVRGVVVDADDGHGIAGATLATESIGVAVPSVTTDASGSFRFAMVPFEVSVLVASAPGYVSARVTMNPREDQPEPALRVALRVGQPVLGDVVDADGKPISARVVVCEGQPLELRIKTAKDGSFSLPPQAIGCDAMALHDSLGPSEPVRVEDGKRTRLRLGAGGGIAGTVVDDRGSGIDAFSVGVESFIPSRGTSDAPNVTAAFTNGAFRFDHLSPGTYVLTAFTKGRPPARSTPVAVRSGSVTDNVRVVMASGGIIIGRVDDGHVPLADVELRFDAVSAITGSDAVTTTDAAGRYRLEGAPQGPLTVAVRKRGYRTKFVSAVWVDAGRTITRDITLSAIDGGPGLELGGIGANVQATDGRLVFATVQPGDPAERAGIHPGDRIVRIDGESTAGMSAIDAIQRIRGEAGVAVGITVERDGASLDLVVTRATLLR